MIFFFFFQAEDGIRDGRVTGIQTCALPILLAGVKAGTLTLAGVLGRDDDLARKTKVNQVIRALPGVGKARAAAIMERAGIPAERRVGGLGARQREQLLAESAGE